MDQSKISLADRLIAISTTVSFYDTMAFYLLNECLGRNYLNAYAAGLYELTGKQKWKDFSSRILDVEELLEEIWFEGEELANQTEELTCSLKNEALSQTEFVLWFNAFVDVIDFKPEKKDFVLHASAVFIRNRHLVPEEICSAFIVIFSEMHMQTEFIAFIRQMGLRVLPLLTTVGEA